MTNDYPVPAVELQRVCDEVVQSAGDLILQMVDKPLEIKEKGYRDIVTEADFAAQELITSEILTRFPTHGFLTEEQDPALPRDGSIIWIIDPIDGTTNFSRQIPVFAVSVAAAVKISPSAELYEPNQWEILAGAVCDPSRKELFSAGLGRGSWLNGKTINVSDIADIERAAVSFDWSRTSGKRQTMLESIGRYLHSVRTVRATGSATLAMAWIACGRFDLYYNLNIGPWDAAAAKIIVQEAGGDVTDLWGKPWQPGDSTCIFSNRRLHSQFIDLLKIEPGL